jgi:predicted pyridoxine 5'-phosphate oxidase superfamily flavin-nucleotide-binding protein
MSTASAGAGTIGDVAALEACIGTTPGPVNLKVIDYLDEGARRWIAASILCFAGFGDADGVGITLGGGVPGFVQATGPTRLKLPAASLDEPDLAVAGRGFGALFLASGIGETLRVNGRVAAAAADAVEIAVEECYIHCAKALIRSDFWRAAPRADAPEDVAAFLGASQFLALATVDGQGRADVSPKGDPSGALIRLQGGAACYADRPGNRRADSFRNILAQPRVAAASLVPGATRVAILSGAARLTTDEAMRASFAVQGKMPLLATCIERPQLVVRESAALRRARLWPAGRPVDGLNAAEILTSHVRLNRTGGLQARLVRAAVSVPGLMEKGLRHDYKTNLY